MSDFNKGDSALHPTTNKEYHTHMWELTKNGKWKKDEELNAYINKFAGEGYVLDSVTKLGRSNLLMIFVKN
jgi:hypothetical protein